MTTSESSSRVVPASSPVALLELQVQLLRDLSAQQSVAQEALVAQIEHMRSEQSLQTEKIVMALKASRLDKPELAGPQAVEVTAFNMRFWSLVGFILKLWLATIPAVVVFAALWFLVITLLGGGAGVLGILLNLGR
jgi:hypothetical protein